MMRLLFVAFVCITVVYGAGTAVVCPSAVCQTSGNTCAATSTTAYQCDYGLYCDSTSTCATTLTNTTTCDSTLLGCAEGYTCTGSVATSYSCTPIPVGPGMLCDNSAQCAYSSGTMTNSSCISGTCYGVASGGVCNSPYHQCNPGLYCNGTFTSPMTCVPQLAEGADCSVGTYTPYYGCGQNLFCSPASKVCTKLYSVPTGGACAAITHCQEGNFCPTYVYPATYSNCTASFTSSKTACTYQADCTVDYETCACNSSGVAACTAPAVYNTGYGAAAMAYTACLATASYTCNTFTYGGGCSACSSQFCAMLKITNPTLASNSLCHLSTAEKALVQSCYPATTTASGTAGSGTAASGTGSGTTASGKTATTTSSGSSVVFSFVIMMVITVFTLF